MSARVGIPEDLDFDPTYARQRKVARWLLGITINQFPEASTPNHMSREKQPTRSDLIKIALDTGLVWFDEWHHAPLCKANNWSRQRLPEGPCTCGAERHQIR